MHISIKFCLVFFIISLSIHVVLIVFYYIFVSFRILVYFIAFRILVYFVSFRIFSIFRFVALRFVIFRCVSISFRILVQPLALCPCLVKIGSGY